MHASYCNENIINRFNWEDESYLDALEGTETHSLLLALFSSVIRLLYFCFALAKRTFT